MMQCADLGCIEKPLDFVHPSIIISRVKALLADSCSEENVSIGRIAKSASF
jgi:hypothetical protein